jgi:2,3-bisphosphoglycerate-independent phosphoglycerate mutase
MAETEKYPHVTYFLNGGREEPYRGEDRIMVPSPKVATYDLQPEMSAPELTDKAVAAIDSGKYDLIVLNYRQSRHGRPHRQPAGRDQGGGDGRHGSADRRRHRSGRRRAAGHRRPRQLRDDARSRTGGPHTAHTTNPVPLSAAARAIARCADGRLADIAPTCWS